MIDYALLREMANVHKQELSESSQYALDMALETFGEDVLVNGVAKKAVINNKQNRDGSEKVMFIPIGEIEIGDEITFKNQKWLNTSYPVESNVYSKVFIKRCNSSISIPTKTVKVAVGEDWRKIPKYEEQGAEPIDIPCVVESMYYASETDDKPINLPSGQIMISLAYNAYSKNIKLDFNFTMFSDKYKVVRIGRNHIIGERGILVLTCELDN